MSPWDIHNTLMAWGPDFRRGVSDVPAGNPDIAPTVLRLAGVPVTGEPLDGRVLTRRLTGEPAGQSFGTRIFRAGASAIQISSVDGRWYVDKAWSDESTTEPQGPLAAVGQGGVGGTVPATLALTLGAPASFGAFTPGVAREYTASTTATVISSAGDATLSVADPSTTATGHLVNGAFALPAAAAGRRRPARRAQDLDGAGLQRGRDRRLQAGDRRRRRAAHGHLRRRR